MKIIDKNYRENTPIKVQLENANYAIRFLLITNIITLVLLILK
jgi:hypothetical protein